MATLSYAEAIREGLAEAMAADPSVFLLGEDIGASGGVFGVTKGLLERFGEDRVLDTPISEEALVGAGVGAALLGARPVVEIMFGDFAALAMDQIVNQAAKIHYMTGGQLHAPLVIRVVTGTAGATAAQHSQSLEAWFAHTPGLKVVAPSTPAEAKELLLASIADPDPVIFLEHKLLYTQKGEVPEAGAPPARLGTARIRRPGRDLTVVSYLKTLDYALAAAETLATEGIECEVVDLRSLVPLDWATIEESLSRTGRLLVAHEAPTRAGFGAEIAALAAERAWDLLRAPIVRVGNPNTPVPYAPEMEGFALPGAERLAEAARRLVAGSAVRSGAGK